MGICDICHAPATVEVEFLIRDRAGVPSRYVMSVCDTCAEVLREDAGGEDVSLRPAS